MRSFKKSKLRTQHCIFGFWWTF